MKKEKKKRQKASSLFVLLPSLIIGALCGLLITRYIDLPHSEGGGFLSVFLLFAILILSLYMQIILHEAGHLICGLLSGYQFSSFRIGSLILVRSRGKLHFGRLTIAGTGGQCLMRPPMLKDGKIPVRLYNLGGAIMNLLLSVLFFILYFLAAPGILKTACLMNIVLGLLFAATNGIPMRMGLIDNDGKNAFSLEKNPDAILAFYHQLKVNESVAECIRLRDMPIEWFTVADEADRENAMVATIEVFACNRLMDELRFEEAEEKIRALLSRGGAVGLHRNLLTCDLFYLTLRKGDWQGAAALITKEQKAFMRAMKKFPTVIRTEYLFARYVSKDNAALAKQTDLWKRCKKHYPYSADIASEQELIDLMEASAAEHKMN